MSSTLTFTVPVLASLDILKTVEFYRQQLGFQIIYAQPGEYGIVQRDDVSIHFWKCDDKNIPAMTSCRVGVNGIGHLYEELQPKGIVHPNAPLALKPWGSQEFGIIDGDGNLVTFFERMPAN